MKIAISWTMGNFKVTAATDVEVNEPMSPMNKILTEHGFLQNLQRTPASKAEKAVAMKLNLWGGADKRPSDFKRNTIPYSEDNAMLLAEGFGTEVEVAEGVKLKFAITDVVEHEGSDAGQSRKRATALVDTLLTSEESKKALIATLGVLGMKDAATADREALIAFAHSKGLGSK